VIVKNKHVIAMGYNGAAPGQKDCLERGFCTKHKGGDCLAEGLHGESNAILSAAKDGISVEGATMYCIYSPCRACCNMIKAAGITKVYYDTLYDNYPDGPQYLKSLGVEIIMLVILDPRKMQHM
jgi:dCMP deaminase